MIRQLLLTQLDYTEWADRRLLLACRRLTPEEFGRDLGASHSSVAATLRHIFYAERVWTRRLLASSLPPFNLLGDPKSDPGPALDLNLAILEEHWPPIWKSIREWLEGHSEADLGQELASAYPGRGQFFVSRWKIVVHMVNHSTLHRGQVLTMLRGFGQEPPNLDIFTFYLPE